MIKLAMIAAIILAAAMAFFAVQNAQHTQVTFMSWYFDGPLVIVLLLSFGAGVLTTLLALLPGSLSKSVEMSKLKSSLADCMTKQKLQETQQKALEQTNPTGEKHE